MHSTESTQEGDPPHAPPVNTAQSSDRPPIGALGNRRIAKAGATAISRMKADVKERILWPWRQRSRMLPRDSDSARGQGPAIEAIARESRPVVPHPRLLL